MLLQTCMRFFVLWNTKEDILKKAGNPGRQLMDPTHFHFGKNKYSSNYHLLCLTEKRNSDRFATTMSCLTCLKLSS